MKILAAADIHGAQYRLNILLDNIEKFSPDLVIICGDITQFGPGEVAKNFLNQIPIETLAVTGNIDTPDVFQAINDSNATNIEMKKVAIDDISFVGINGVNEIHTNHFFDENNDILDGKSVMVTHVPPFNTQDKVFMGKHAGSIELKKVVDRFRPMLVLSGHIHEDPGFMKKNETVFVNCSMGKRGEGALIEINNDISVKMLE